MKAVKIVSTIIILVAMVISLTGFQFLFVVGVKLTDPGFYLSRFEKSGIYSEMEEWVEYSLAESLNREIGLGDTGLPDLKVGDIIAEGIVTEEWIAGQANVFITGLLSYLRGNADTLPVIEIDPIIDNFAMNINKGVEKIVREMDLPISINISIKIKDSITEEMTGIPFSPYWDEGEKSAFKKDMEPVRVFISSVRFAMYFLLIFALILVAVVWFIWRRFKPWKVSVGAGFILAGLITAGPFIIIFLTLRGRLMEYLMIPDATFASLNSILASMLEDITMTITISASFLLLLGITLVFVPYSKS